MLLKGDYTILYRRGNYAAVVINRSGEHHVVDLNVKCPKKRLWSLAEFPTDAEATQYCKQLWQGACHLTQAKEAVPRTPGRPLEEVSNDE